MSEIAATATTADKNSNGNNGSDKKPIEPKQEVPLLRSSSETLKRPAEPEPEFVLVKDLISGELMELPTAESDNTLGLATLTHAFPGSHGLKYKTDSGAFRALLIDSTGQKFYPPTTGWSGKTFTVIFNNTPLANPAPVVSESSTPKLRSNSDQNAKRKKMMDENESSDSESGHHSSHSGQVTAKQKRMESVKNEEIDDKDEHPCSDLIVLGLPFKSTEKDLDEYFGQFGKLKLCEIKKDGKGASKGFGFIQFENYESQLRVLTRPIHTIGGRRCEVRIPLSKKGDSRNESSGIEHAKLFIGRLQEKTSESFLKEFFLSEARKIDPKANIIDTFIPKPFRSFAFITFSSPRIVRELIKKGDFIIDGSSVSVSSAAPKTSESSYSGGYAASDRSYPDYSYPGEWSGRSSMQRPTTQFNEQAFVRPYEQRKRTFMETAYGIPNEYSPQQTPGMLPPPAGGSQALASGFETLNLNQLPANNHEIMTAFSQYLSSQGAAMAPPPRPQQMPRYQQQGPPPGLRARHDYNAPGRGNDHRTQYPSPYSRDDAYY